MSKADPDYEASESHFCYEHMRYKIQDFGGNNICIECLLVEIEFQRMVGEMDNGEILE